MRKFVSKKNYVQPSNQAIYALPSASYATAPRFNAYTTATIETFR